MPATKPGPKTDRPRTPTNYRMPLDLLEELKEYAFQQRISTNALVIQLLDAGIRAGKRSGRYIPNGRYVPAEPAPAEPDQDAA